MIFISSSREGRTRRAWSEKSHVDREYRHGEPGKDSVIRIGLPESGQNSIIRKKAWHQDYTQTNGTPAFWKTVFLTASCLRSPLHLRITRCIGAGQDLQVGLNSSSEWRGGSVRIDRSSIFPLTTNIKRTAKRTEIASVLFTTIS